MRQAGVIPDQRQATRFADYLLTKGIVTRVDNEPDGFVVWIRDEQHIETSRRELSEFLLDPNNPQYVGVEKDAAEIRKEEDRRLKDYRKNLVDVRNRWQRGLSGSYPVTKVVLVLMLAATLLANFGDHDNPIAQALFIAPFTITSSTIQWTHLQAIEDGQIWRLITPIFMHGDLLHLLFGLYMFYMFGRLVETRRGSWRILFLILISAVLSNIAQYWMADFTEWRHDIIQPSPRFLGMSGVIYAMFGYAWMRSQVDPGSGLTLPRQTVVILMIWLIICILHIIPHVANIAHVAGLLTGMAIGYAPAIIPKMRQWT